jgi:transcription elongation factor GreA
MTDKMPITLAGKLALEEELKHLKGVERPAIIEAISAAREQGDLKENAEYSSAREKQSFIEGRIMDIGDKLARAEVIDPKIVKSSRIVFGATVTVNDENGKKAIYQVVGEPEANLSAGKISVSSPLAKALLGREVGDEAILKSPRGEITYEILKIDYI